MSEYTAERNAYVQLLRAEIVKREGFPDPLQDALKWAVRRLEGLPEHWVMVDG